MKTSIKTKKISLKGKEHFCTAEVLGSDTWVTIDGTSFKLDNLGVRRLKQTSAGSMRSGAICAPMPGQILKVFVSNDETVETGDSLFVVEAMKMEHTLKAPCSGTVSGLKFKAGDTVTGSDIILTVTQEGDHG